MAKVLIIDDDEQLCRMLSLKISILGHQAQSAPSLHEGLELVRAGEHAVVYLDVRLPDGDGLDLLPALRELPWRPEVIIMTGAGDPDGAELAIKSGAWDYIAKPASVQAMTLPLLRALQYRQERASLSLPVALKREGLVGEARALRHALDLLAQAALSQAAVLITGETGTGKELFARAIHANSVRASGPLVVVDCTALPPALAESLLFGHERGAFTSASEPREGLIRQAHGGTLFLDEVGELPINLQKAFLRVLQERRFRPLGSRQEMISDFRLLAATNRDLEEMTRQGRFRADLLYRLRALTIHLPPLRQRAGDIRLLALHYLERLGQRYGLGTKGLSPEFMEALNAYDWPGNVRELVNTVEQALSAAGQAPTLFARHLPEHIRVALARASLSKDSGPGAPPPEASTESGGEDPDRPLPTLRQQRAQNDRRYLLELMRQTGWNTSQACRISGLSRSRLYELLRSHGLERGQNEGA